MHVVQPTEHPANPTAESDEQDGNESGSSSTYRPAKKARKSDDRISNLLGDIFSIRLAVSKASCLR